MSEMNSFLDKKTEKSDRFFTLSVSPKWLEKKYQIIKFLV